MKLSNLYLKVLVPCLILSACDMSDLLDPSAKKKEQQRIESKAIGAACRHASRALEDCFVQNPKSTKAGIVEGWKEMDGYMRENNIAAVIPNLAASSMGPGEEIIESNKTKRIP